MWEIFNDWLRSHDNGLVIGLTIVISYATWRIGKVVIAAIVHRTVGRLQTDNSEDDIKKRQDTLIGLLRTILKTLLWATVVFTILGRFGLDLAPLLASASVLGVAIGFGAQSLIKDFLSGLFIILENQYRVGDVVDLSGAAGKVEQITIRSTVIRDNDGSVHYIPNGSITHIINKTMGFSNVNLTISVVPETNVDKLADIINKVGDEMLKDDKWAKSLMEPPHFVSIGNFSEKSLEVKISGKTQPSKQWAVTNELRKRLFATLKKHKIELA